MKKLLLVATAAILSIPSIPSALAQRVYVQIDPPHVIVEHHGPRPHRGWIWVDGHHQWDGHHYVWVHGYWIAPPHEHAVWVPGEWRHEPGGWFWVDGHWRG
jgi:hypothetical protein